MNSAHPDHEARLDHEAHLDYETLADLAEGILDDDHAASATEHLADCDECRERSAELADVSRLLAESPVPPMPAKLAARIDAAIAAESVSTATVASLQARRGRMHLRMLSAAAAAIVVVGGAVAVGRTAMDSPSTPSDVNARVPVHQERTDRSEGTSSPEAPGVASVAPKTAPLSSAKYRVTRTGTDYRDTTVGSQITDMLRRGDLPVTQPTEQLSACVDRIAGGRQPLLVDVADYDGEPATVIVLPTQNRSDLDVWVVGSKCSTKASDVLMRTRASR
ncbi:anti-sigma factor family protein [Actinomadura sp. HBU206391]|uniref:anti-sigma factor family protein n=1 Tax=Actinomadura sp. HBU206391 TaxID=2731692 RepID=UPI0016508541|nr:hypothetical protein [Actinomadura sp. HBU206391]MBC6456477.1 hypothetical protein [Actinomadura sp. HBU206391]